MDEWYTIDKIDDKTYVISEYGHWEKTHCYLLIGGKSAALIDTGLGIGNIKNEVDKLTDLPVKVITTHVHWDHIGGHELFNKIYVHKYDEAWLEKGIPVPLEAIRKNVAGTPFGRKPPENFNIDNYKVHTGKPSGILYDNDIIDIGSRKIRVIHTPGHSPGHICLYEEEKGYLYTGDLIYKGTLFAFYPSTDPVLFKKSVERVNSLKGVTNIFPGHNELDVSVNMIDKIRAAFEYIDGRGLLKQGSGIFDFDEFKIHI